MPASSAPRLAIWKFGGASLADGAAIARAAVRIAAHRGPLVIVASALGGVTDQLLTGASLALQGREREALAIADALRDQHRRAARATRATGRARRALLETIDLALIGYCDLCRAVGVLQHLAPRTQDALVARGEQLSAALLAAAISSHRRGADFVDALDVMRTDAHHGGATPLLADTTRQAQARLRPLLTRGRIPVVPGFIGRAPDDSITTLGRGGSDLTATTLARVLGAREVVLWKDVPGILTSDPRVVPDARLITEMHHQEAAEVAHYGAKVLHPRALIPITGTRITLQVRSFIHPDQPGTVVTARHAAPGHPVKALATLAGQAVVSVSGKGMVGVHGIAARTFAAVDAERLSVSTIFQGSSENSIGFTVPAAEADRAVARISAAFAQEIATGLIDEVTARPGVSVLAVVGDGMAGTPGIAARVFSSLEEGGVNVIAIAQGSSERNISCVVDSSQATEAARRVHAAFKLSKIGGGQAGRVPFTDVVLLGFGGVGQALAAQITALDVSAHIRVVGVIDRSGYLFNASGLSGTTLRRLARAKREGHTLAQSGGEAASTDAALAHMTAHALSRPVIADVTGDDTGSWLATALTQGCDLVLANKKPLAVGAREYQRLFETARQHGRRIRFEATVGAGLPVIDTWHKLVDSGDRVRRIEGCVSGTLMFVLDAVSRDQRFSEAVREAMVRGYAEPDPRDDLNGADAGRKALILARLLGYEGPPVTPESLVPAAMQRWPRQRFLDALPSLDAPWEARVAQARTRGLVWRYVVSATSRSATATLVQVPVTSPMGAAGGTRNLLVFTSDRYRTEPLVVSGPGAGTEVTAAGMLNDIRALARTT